MKIENRKLPLRLEGTQKGSRKKRKLLLRLVERSRMKFGALSGKNENSFSLGSLKNRNCKNNLVTDQKCFVNDAICSNLNGFENIFKGLT